MEDISYYGSTPLQKVGVNGSYPTVPCASCTHQLSSARRQHGGRGYLTAGDGNEWVDVEEVIDEIENGEDDADIVIVLTSSLVAAAVVDVTAGGDVK